MLQSCFGFKFKDRFRYTKSMHNSSWRWKRQLQNLLSKHKREFGLCALPDCRLINKVSWHTDYGFDLKAGFHAAICYFYSPVRKYSADGCPFHGFVQFLSLGPVWAGSLVSGICDCGLLVGLQTSHKTTQFVYFRFFCGQCDSPGNTPRFQVPQQLILQSFWRLNANFEALVPTTEKCQKSRISRLRPHICFA